MNKKQKDAIRLVKALYAPEDFQPGAAWSGADELRIAVESIVDAFPKIRVEDAPAAHIDDELAAVLWKSEDGTVLCYLYGCRGLDRFQEDEIQYCGSSVDVYRRKRV